ncbi:MAG: pyruvate:ferredoxin (flavodoxin) oxidoreductase [Acidimicrobiia bacterium]
MSKLIVDGNEAAARIAYAASEVIAIYPITPSSPMGELADEWAARGRPNAWGALPEVTQMQSEGGAAGALHGALQAGALATTFTASQGLLLMIPDMYKIAGELTPFVAHVAARTVATHALSIFGDHSDVMAVRSTGFGMLASSSVQEAQDLAAIAHAATLETRIPFVHFFDGFRTSHEINRIEALDDDDLRTLIRRGEIRSHRDRRLTPDRPVLRGSAQNPDVFFQAREAASPFYAATPDLVQEVMDRFGELTGRSYHLFDYVGAPDAEVVLVLMGSGIGAAEEAVAYLNETGAKVGLLKVRLFRPFSPGALVGALPATVCKLAVLDRTKEPGAPGEPLYQDVVASLVEEVQAGTAAFGGMPQVIGGRYGLSSKEFTPGMVVRIFEELSREKPRPHFTVGIRDDVSGSSLDYDPTLSTETERRLQAVFYGLGSDGTVGANKSSAKIIGSFTDLWVQAYFVYDSRKAGARTVSHLRFATEPISSTYLIREADFVACHQFDFIDDEHILARAAPGAIFLLNSPHPADQVWDQLPAAIQAQIIARSLRFFVVDAARVAREAGLGGRINTVMQTCFFALTDLIPFKEAIAAIKSQIEVAYRRFGPTVVERNHRAVEEAAETLSEVEVPERVTATHQLRTQVPESAPDFVQRVTVTLLEGKGDLLPVSALPVDGTFPTGTARLEKRGLAEEIPIWDAEICIDCGKCALVCPHAAIRMKVYEPAWLEKAPAGFLSKEFKWRDRPGQVMTIQVAPDDCTGCGVCVDVCPAMSKEIARHKSINMEPREPHLATERERFDFFLTIPEVDRTALNVATVKTSQMLDPLFEFSSACAGCGETPYLKLLTQLFGDRILVANATGCSSIYGGNLPTTPWSANRDGRGPAWSNSLFEDNAEFGLGMRLGLDRQHDYAVRLLETLRDEVGPDLVEALMAADQSDEAGIAAQRDRVAALKERLVDLESEDASDLLTLADIMVRKSVWIVGGDGWAYDIGFGGLDHVLASGRDVNLLVLDTEVYSNTGGQASKSTPRAAVAKFAAAGKAIRKKDLGLIAAAYGDVYVAQVAVGANNTQTVKAFTEAESYRGPSLLLAYSQCIAHGIDMATGMTHQKEAVESGYWPLYRYDPRHAVAGDHPFHLDSRSPSKPFKDFAQKEARFAMLQTANPEKADELIALAQEDIDERWRYYTQITDVERIVPDEEVTG